MTKQPNIILIILDTLRKDTLYENLNRLPHINSVISRAYTYSNAVTPSSWTVPAHASMFTGKYPSEHGMTTKYDPEEMIKGMSQFPHKGMTVQEKLIGSGYENILISSNVMVGNETAFNTGFESVYGVGPVIKQMNYSKEQHKIAEGIELGKFQSLKGMIELRRKIGSNNLIRIMKLGLSRRLYNNTYNFPLNKGYQEVLKRFKESHPKQPYFAYLNCLEMHEPYKMRVNKLSPFDITEPFEVSRKVFLNARVTGNTEVLDSQSLLIKQFRNSLWDEVQLLDRFIGELVSYLKEKGEYDESLIIITSDHGQSLGEDNFLGHEYLLNDPIVNVPLIVKRPNNTFSIVDKVVNILGVSDLILNTVIDGKYDFPETEFTFSESYGYNSKRWENYLGPKFENYEPEIMKRIWSRDGYSLTVEGSKGHIESFSKNGIAF